MSVSIRSLQLAASAVLAGVAIALVTAPVARAFTFEDGQGGASSGGSNWKDLELPKPKADEPDSRFKSEDGLTTYKQGNSTFFFGSRPSFDQKYNPSNLFDPYARDGRK